MKSHRSRLVFGSIFFLLFVGSFFFFRVSSRKEDVRFSPQELETLLAAKDQALIQGFMNSRAKPLFIGDTFPLLDYPVVMGGDIDWQAPSIITVGIAKSSSAIQLYKDIEPLRIQKIHISLTNDLPSEILKADPTVIILDGSDVEMKGFNVPKQVVRDLGLYDRVAAYLVDENRKVVYARVNKGRYDYLSEHIENILSDSVANFQLDPSLHQTLLPIGKELSLDAMPDEFREMVRTEMHKPFAIVFLSNEAACDACRYFLRESAPFREKWESAGYGMILVEGGQPSFQVQQVDGNFLRIADVVSSDGAMDPELMASWGSTFFPATLILKDGKLQGIVPWLETHIDGKNYRDIHYRAISKILDLLSQESI